MKKNILSIVRKKWYRFRLRKCAVIYKELKKKDKHDILKDDLLDCLDFMEKEFKSVIENNRLIPYVPNEKYQTNSARYKKILFDIAWIEDLYIEGSPEAMDAFLFKLGHEIGHKKCIKVDKKGDFFLFTYIMVAILIVFGIATMILTKSITLGIILTLVAWGILEGVALKKIIKFERHVCECHSDYCGVAIRKEKVNIKKF